MKIHNLKFMHKEKRIHTIQSFCWVGRHWNNSRYPHEIKLFLWPGPICTTLLYFVQEGVRGGWCSHRRMNRWMGTWCRHHITKGEARTLYLFSQFRPPWYLHQRLSSPSICQMKTKITRGRKTGKTCEGGGRNNGSRRQGDKAVVDYWGAYDQPFTINQSKADFAYRSPVHR